MVITPLPELIYALTPQ